MRRAIENAPSGYISINRFNILLDKLSLKIKVHTEYEHNEVRSSEKHIEEKPKKKYKRRNRNNDPYCKQGHISSRYVSSIAQHSI